VTNRVVLSEIEARNVEIDHVSGAIGTNQSVCEAEGCENEGKFYCKSCKVSLCGECDQEIHRRLSKHQRILVSDKEFEYRECGRHKEEFKLFCETHDTMVCSVCVSLEHKLFCVVKGVNEVALVKKELIEQKISEIDVLKKDVSLKINEFVVRQDEMKNDENKRLGEIQQRADSEIENIMAKCNAEIDVERAKFSQEKERIQSVLSEYLDKMNRLENFMKDCVNVRNRNSAVYTIKVAESLKTILNNSGDQNHVNLSGPFKAGQFSAFTFEKKSNAAFEMKEPEEFKFSSNVQNHNLIRQREEHRSIPSEFVRSPEEFASITAVPEYQKSSLEELRLAYLHGRPSYNANIIDSNLNSQSQAAHANSAPTVQLNSSFGNLNLNPAHVQDNHSRRSIQRPKRTKNLNRRRN
jgi:hypothetical protein